MRFAVRFGALLLLLAVLYVGGQAVLALVGLEQVERERDTWQRPDAVIDALALAAGHTVADIGAGNGYFAVRLAPVVGRTGRVIAVDIARQPLAFLWIRRTLRRQWQTEVRLADTRNPRLDLHSLDRALIVNTYHELEDPAATLAAVHTALKRDGRLVVVDLRPRAGPGASPAAERARHTLSPDIALTEIAPAGFALLQRDDTFIDRAGDEPWWLMVFRVR